MGATINDIELKLTCGACPEQYDAFIDDKQVGYLRLRFGYFSVETPDYGGDLVFEHEFEDGWKGEFDEDERELFLNKAKEAILKHIQ